MHVGLRKAANGGQKSPNVCENVYSLGSTDIYLNLQNTQNLMKKLFKRWTIKVKELEIEMRKMCYTINFCSKTLEISMFKNS